MSQPILLDTCAAIWLANKSTLRAEALSALEASQSRSEDIWVSPITAWEIGTLVSRGRLALTLNPAVWFRTLLSAGIRLAPMPPDILIASAFLPGSTLRDPADRILAATARAYGYQLMTRDGLLLDYAAQGHMAALAC